MLTVKQAAARASVSQSLVYDLCAAGAIPHMRVGRPGRRGKVLIDERDLDAFLASRRREGAPEAPTPPPLSHIRMNARHG